MKMLAHPAIAGCWVTLASLANPTYKDSRTSCCYFMVLWRLAAYGHVFSREKGLRDFVFSYKTYKGLTGGPDDLVVWVALATRGVDVIYD
jgi:hypothetical protein